MKISEFSKELESRAGIGKYAQIMNILLLLVVAAQAFALAKADRTHRETLIPPSVSKTFWIEDDRVSPEYLEQMGLYLIQLALNRSPANAENQIKELLRYVAPSSYPELEKQLMAEVIRQKEDRVSTVYFPRTVTPSIDKQGVLFEGELRTWISDKLVKQEQKRYLIKFGYRGKVFIEEIKDVTNEKDPWNAA